MGHSRGVGFWQPKRRTIGERFEVGATQHKIRAVFEISGFRESFDLGDPMKTRRCRRPFAPDARSLGIE
jgi:hypothetical protein